VWALGVIATPTCIPSALNAIYEGQSTKVRPEEGGTVWALGVIAIPTCTPSALNAIYEGQLTKVRPEKKGDSVGPGGDRHSHLHTLSIGRHLRGTIH
jgi:hypothetical protein